MYPEPLLWSLNSGDSSKIMDPYVENQIKRIAPSSVVDFVAGKGKYGCMVRYLFPNTRAIAVEIFPLTANLLKRIHDYNEVCKEDLRNWLNRNEEKFDLGVFGDVLEHLEKRQILPCIEKACDFFEHIIIIVPSRNARQGARGGNQWEEHRAHIDEDDIHCGNIIEKRIVRKGGPESDYFKMDLWKDNWHLFNRREGVRDTWGGGTGE